MDDCQMTCIVAIKHKNSVYIGADSAGVSGVDIRIRKDPKVFYKNGMVFGFTDSFRMGQILHHDFIPPDYDRSYSSHYEFMVSCFIPHLKECFRVNGYGKIADGTESEGGEFLVGFKGEIYQIQCDFQVGINIDNYSSCGCGEPFALGYLYATEKGKLKPKDRVKEALKCAAYFSGGVAPPFKIIGVDNLGNKIKL